MKIAVMMLALTIGLQAMACTIDGKEGFLPENDYNIPAGLKLNYKTLTEQEFNDVITAVETVYAPVVAEKGGKLKIQRNWKDGTVNAYAKRSGSTYVVAMFGGLARHKETTKDGFAMVVCHELGHHIGGAPKSTSIAGGWGGSGSVRWASNEGQSDYFASLKCMRNVFKGDNNKKIMADVQVPAAVQTQCAKNFGKDNDEYYMCERSSMAGLSLARLLSDLRKDSKKPTFDTPDTRVVGATDHSHPQAQCRLDTYFAGAICGVSENDDVSDEDETVGTCARVKSFTTGVRPLCWFKPKAI